jgi:hypothetical protein
MAVPPKLEKELGELRSTHPMEVVEEPGCINVVFKEFTLGEGFSRPTSDLLVRVPKSYPEAGPDMFYTSPEVTLASGLNPQSAEHNEIHIGKQWRRFSWHKAAWNPSVDNMHGYLEFIRKRLREKK